MEKYLEIMLLDYAQVIEKAKRIDIDIIALVNLTDEELYNFLVFLQNTNNYNFTRYKPILTYLRGQVRIEPIFKCVRFSGYQKGIHVKESRIFYLKTFGEVKIIDLLSNFLIKCEVDNYKNILLPEKSFTDLIIQLKQKNLMNFYLGFQCKQLNIHGYTVHKGSNNDQTIIFF